MTAAVTLSVPPPPRSPWQLLYGSAHRLRRSWWRRRARRLPRPVISVGNLHWGGAGKTPLVAALAAHLRDRGIAVCILSRGYGGRGRGVRVVSQGKGPLLGPLSAGDEPVLLAGELPGVAVVVGRERAEAGRAALERLPHSPEVFLLDDGFSHLALHRDLDLLVLPAADPFGGGRLAPSGRLREPLAAAARADAVLLTGAEVDADSGAELAAALGPYGFDGPGFACPIHSRPPRFLDGSPVPPGTRVLLVSAIARPERFAASAAGFPLDIAGELRFPDHHPYPEASCEEILHGLRRHGATVVLATVKDRVKLQGRLDAPLAELPIAAEPEPAFWSWLEAKLPAIF